MEEHFQGMQSMPLETKSAPENLIRASVNFDEGFCIGASEQHQNEADVARV